MVMMMMMMMMMAVSLVVVVAMAMVAMIALSSAGLAWAGDSVLSSEWTLLPHYWPIAGWLAQMTADEEIEIVSPFRPFSFFSFFSIDSLGACVCSVLFFSGQLLGRPFLNEQWWCAGGNWKVAVFQCCC